MAATAWGTLLTVLLATTTITVTVSADSLLKKLYAGCYKEDASDRDLPTLVIDDAPELVIEKCMTMCQRQGFRFAGLQGGNNCYCGNGVARIHGESDACSSRCSGDSSQECGGPSSNSVYNVPYDNRYLGCYHDNSSDPDLPELMWEKDEERSAAECIDECAKQNYKFAGVQDGGSCYCGNSYGRHFGAPERDCSVLCETTGSHQNCGGVERNAIYRTEIPFDLNQGQIPADATKAYDSSGKMTGISTRIFSYAPGLRSIITKKLVIHATHAVEAPYEDPHCEAGCYETCGEIDDNTLTSDTLILRFFHMRLSDLPKYVSDSTKYVYIYAQTVVIDTDIDVAFALQIRTRQLILNRSKALQISVSSRAKNLNINMNNAKYIGPEPDMLHTKQSYMCARIMYETRDRTNINLAWDMMRTLSDYQGTDEEMQAYAGYLRAVEAEFAGLTRFDIRFVPFYTKEHLSYILGNYYDFISLYKKEYDRLHDQSLALEEFLQVGESLHKIYSDTDIAEAEIESEAIQEALNIATLTHDRIQKEFEYSRIRLEEAKSTLLPGLIEAAIWAVVKTAIEYVGEVSKSMAGVTDEPEFESDTKETIGYEEHVVSSSFDIVSHQVFRSDRLDMIFDIIKERIDLGDLGLNGTGSIEDIIDSIIDTDEIKHWDLIKMFAEILFNDLRVFGIKGAREYRVLLADTLNWGKALVKAKLEKAELMRKSLDAKMEVSAKQRQQKRILGIFDDARKGNTERAEVMSAMIEQTYDVKMDLNEVLTMFCQAYFYENLQECKESYKPKFGGSLNDLLNQINSAKRDHLLVTEAPSTASRIVKIEDTDTDPDCNDATVCPVNYFRNHRVLYFDLPVDHKDMFDLDKYKVAEIIMNFVGAEAKGENTFLKVTIEASGDFQSQSKGTVYDFLTKPVSLAFEYDTISGHISLRADVYKAYRNIVNHITPFTTWVMRVDENRSPDIDVSKVKHIEMLLKGSAISNA